jgi:transketolase
MEINKKQARSWSRMGPRATYGQCISALSNRYDEIIAISADLGRSSGLDRFSKESPEKFINVGIGEQNMVAFGSGLSRTGFTVFASTFAPFASMRASEQVRMNLGYMKEPLNLVALGSGLSLGMLGNSHFGLEDVAVMSSIPNLKIVCPADCVELYKTLEASCEDVSPKYIRLTGAMNTPIVYETDYDFQIGKAIWIEPAAEVNIIATGTSVGHAKTAIAELTKLGFSIGLLNMHTISPLDTGALDEVARISKRIFIIEEHFLSGGLYSKVLEYYNGSCKSFAKISSLSIPMSYVETGTYEFMLSNLELDADGILKKIAKVLNTNSNKQQ